MTNKTMSTSGGEQGGAAQFGNKNGTNTHTRTGQIGCLAVN